jgi:hypothetical protein
MHWLSNGNRGEGGDLFTCDPERLVVEDLEIGAFIYIRAP